MLVGSVVGSAPAHAATATRGEILLLSAFPEVHSGMIDALRFEGFRVRAPRPPRIQRLDVRSADLVLVDLIHGPGLTPAMIGTLNRTHGQAMVVALHEGSLEPGLRVAAALTIEGFCRPDDCVPSLRALKVRHPGRGESREPSKNTSFVDAPRTKSLKSEPPRSVSRKVRP